MVQASQPVNKDTAPSWVQSRTLMHFYNSREIAAYLDRTCEKCPEGCDCPFPPEWLPAAAMEAYTAFTETLDTWVETLIAGRPPTKPLVEWEHRELVDYDDAKEIAANQGHRW